MSATELPEDAARVKVDADDHDLLTFGEAGERLRVEIAAAAATAARLQDCGDPTQLQKAQTRLTALRDALQRNAAQPINDANFETFFGYPAKAKRNLPGTRAGE